MATRFNNYRGVDINDLCRIAGVPELGALVGNAYFLDPVSGNDANPGTRPDKAVKTWAVAYALLTANQHDVLFVLDASSDLTIPSGGGITWAKDQTHLIGVSARQVTIQPATGQDLTPFVTWSADDCVCTNIKFLHALDSSDSEICFLLSGDYNKFKNVHFAGIGHATQGDDTGAASLSMSGALENDFLQCEIGLSTVARSGANTEILIAGTTKDNTFRQCKISALADNAGHYFVNASAAAADLLGLILFDQCVFANAPNVTGYTAMTTGFKLHASLTGTLLLKDSVMIGATDVDADDTGSAYVTDASPTANASALAVATAAT